MSQFSKPSRLTDSTEMQPSRVANSPTQESEFVTDAWLADQMQMAVATIRSQRWKRLHGLDHWLDLAPVYIGSKPRYRRSEAISWLKGQVNTEVIAV